MELGLHTNRHRGFSSRPHGARAILWRAPGVCLAAFCDLARLPVFALPPAESLRILMGPDASHTQNSIAAVSAEAARQPMTVHPRACGERVPGITLVNNDYGSSPRVRGTRGYRTGNLRGRRFIPARAGNAAGCHPPRPR